MSFPDQSAFDFVTGQPRRPQKPERLFLGLFPDERAGQAVHGLGTQTANELSLTGELLSIDRFHTSLVHISDRKRVRSKDEFAADLAAKTVKIPPFEITYSRLGSFPGVPKKDRPLEHPLVLLADEGPVMDLYAALSRRLSGSSATGRRMGSGRISPSPTTGSSCRCARSSPSPLS